MSLQSNESNEFETWNDAVVYGDLDSHEAHAVLNQTIDTLVGFTAKQQRNSWLHWSPTLAHLIDTKLSRHEIKRDKDGHSAVFARARVLEGDPTSQYGGAIYSQRGRTLHDIEAVTVAGLDIDDGPELAVMINRLEALGLFAILYTTHSHGKRVDGRAINKYRILFPLAVPFELALGDKLNHRQRCSEWRFRLATFAKATLGIDVDESGGDVNRLFYTPRHKPGAKDWFCAIFAGRALHVEEMPFDPDAMQTRQRRVPNKDGEVVAFSGKRSVLPDGFDLVDWRRDWGAYFKVSTFFEFMDWDFGKLPSGTGEARILCPMDENHSVSDDNQAVWIRDGDRAESFAIHCHHASCAEFGALDRIVALSAEIDLPNGYTALSEVLCDPGLYNRDDGKFPDRDGYLRWDPDEDDDECEAVNPKGGAQ